MIINRIPFPIPLPPGEIFKIIKMLVEKIFKPPKKNETPDDVAERNEAYFAFCEQVHSEAQKIESYVVQQIEEYGQYLINSTESENSSFLKQYKLHTSGIVSQINLLKMQIPGLIRADVSRRLSDSDAECRHICMMPPGPEKDARINTFLQSVISNAAGKCADVTRDIIQTIQSEFIDELQECLTSSYRQLEQRQFEMETLCNSDDTLSERQQMQNRAGQVLECCDLIDSLLR